MQVEFRLNAMPGLDYNDAYGIVNTRSSASTASLNKYDSHRRHPQSANADTESILTGAPPLAAACIILDGHAAPSKTACPLHRVNG